MLPESIGEVKLHPNPNNGQFTVSTQGVVEKIELSVYNLLGEKVYQSPLNTTNTQIDLSDKSPGMYIYRVLTETETLVGEGRFIVQ
jgi:hypothetical protein